MSDELPSKTTGDRIYEVLAVPAQAFPPTAVIVRLIDTYWPRTYPARMEKSVLNLYEEYKKLDSTLAKKFSDFLLSNEGETLLLMAMESMFKTHKEEKIKNISKTLVGVVNAPIQYDSKEYILKIATELEPFEVILLKRITESTIDYYTIESYEDFFHAIIQNQEITKDEFYYITQKLTTLSLIRISFMLDGFNDIYSSVLITADSDKETRPKIIVTRLGKDILNYFNS